MGIAIDLTDDSFDKKNIGVGYLEYLHGDNLSFIDTGFIGYRNTASDVAGVIPNDLPKIEFKYKANTISKPILGAFEQGAPQANSLDNINKMNLVGKGAVGTGNGVGSDTHIVEYGSVYSYIDGVLISDNSNMGNQYRLNAYPSNTIKLFGNFYGGSAIVLSDVKIYYFKAYINNELKLYLRPYQLNDGTVCMRDELTGAIYLNQGTGTFIAGPYQD